MAHEQTITDEAARIGGSIIALQALVAYLLDTNPERDRILARFDGFTDGIMADAWAKASAGDVHAYLQCSALASGAEDTINAIRDMVAKIKPGT